MGQQKPAREQRPESPGADCPPTQPPLSSFKPGFSSHHDSVSLLWARSHTGLLRTLSTNVTREICQYLSTVPQLPFVCSDRVYVFRCERGRWEQFFGLPTATDRLRLASAFALVGEKQVFAFGVREPKSFAFVLSETEVKSLDSTPHKRYPSVLYLKEKGAVYLFGGMTFHHKMEFCASCERLEVDSSKWSALLPMHEARAFMSLTTLREVVYIVGGYINTSIETFNSETEKFGAASIQLLESGPTVSCVSAGDLLVLSSSGATLWDLRSGQLKEKVDKDLQVTWSSSQPVLWHSALYYVNGNSCIQVTLRELTLTTHSLGFR